MGRDALPDAEKIRRGTFCENRSDNTRRTTAVGNVLTFPTITQIPKCKFPLPEDGLGIQTYNRWCQNLIDAGLLTEVSLGFVESLAIADHTIDISIRQGKAPPGRATNDRNRALAKLELLNVDKGIVKGQTKKGAFGKNGFPARLRLFAAHRAHRPK